MPLMHDLAVARARAFKAAWDLAFWKLIQPWLSTPQVQHGRCRDGKGGNRRRKDWWNR